MNSDEYRNKDYPSRPEKPYLRRGTETAESVRKFADDLAIWETQMVEYNRLVDLYNIRQRKLEDKFKIDVLAEYGLTDHPKAEAVFALAWEEGHSCGYSEVEIWVGRLAELVK